MELEAAPSYSISLSFLQNTFLFYIILYITPPYLPINIACLAFQK